jgi:DMSO/TMAO reductase YedYZ molybdopterin-dependent catalytic subunit
VRASVHDSPSFLLSQVVANIYAGSAAANPCFWEFLIGDRSMIDRRRFLEVAAATGLSAGLVPRAKASINSATCEFDGGATAPARSGGPYLTEAGKFVDVSRGNPKPYKLTGDALKRARLTADTWRLEIIGDGSSQLARPLKVEDGTAIDLGALKELGKSHGVKFLKAMQCNNIPFPLGQGLWEGVPLREVIRLVGKVGNVRRAYYWGFHNNDPAQLFQSSIAFNRAMETPPWEPPPIVAYRLNGQEISLERGGPVRMVLPWAHGFKSVKWLQTIVLTNDHKANDTYALQNNDPESYLKTAAYLGPGETTFKAGEPVFIEGSAMVGWSGLKRVEYWVRAATGGDGKLDDDDPAWKTAVWRPCEIMPPPLDWRPMLPEGTSTKTIWGFDSETGKPQAWPLLFSMVSWTARLDGLPPGSHEFRVRTVDLNGFAQPEPRPYQKSGLNLIPNRTLEVKA